MNQKNNKISEKMIFVRIIGISFGKREDEYSNMRDTVKIQYVDVDSGETTATETENYIYYPEGTLDFCLDDIDIDSNDIRSLFNKPLYIAASLRSDNQGFFLNLDDVYPRNNRRLQYD